MKKPRDVFGRVHEWKALDTFAAGVERSSVGLVYGRRRTGKSYLLRRLAAAHGGLYFQATESDRRDALADFGRAVAAQSTGQRGGPGRRSTVLDPEPIVYRDWDDALRRRDGLLVIDELPYLLRHSPELPSVLQRVIDDAVAGVRPSLRVVLCGSSLSVMTGLLSGQRPLRGRSVLDLFLRPFDYRDAAALWGVDDPELAVRLDSIFGGSPGYRSLTDGLPDSVDGLGEWLARSVLNPAHALYREDDYLLREDPSVTDRSLYLSLLTAIAQGVSTQTELAGRLGRSRESITYPLTTLVRAGFATREEDPIIARRPLYRSADPIVRFLRLVVEPSRSVLDEHRWEPVWQRARHTVDAQIYGPHLESVARRWAFSRYGQGDGRTVTTVGSSTLADSSTRQSVQVDVVALDNTGERQAVRLLGEVKWSPEALGERSVDRLRRARTLLAERGYDVSNCELVLISRSSVRVPDARVVTLRDMYR